MTVSSVENNKSQMSRVDRKYNSSFFKLLSLLTLLLTANPVHSLEPPTEFSFSCPTTMKFRPVCVEIPLRSKQQFLECRVEIKQYLSELDEEYLCIAEAFTKYMNELVKKIEAHLICHEENMSRKANDEALLICEPMRRQYFGVSLHKAFMHQIWLEPPSLYSNRCLERNDVNDSRFFVSCILRWREFVTNAEKIHKDHLKKLATAVREEKENTVDCFNDWSKRLLYSSSCR